MSSSVSQSQNSSLASSVPSPPDPVGEVEDEEMEEEEYGQDNQQVSQQDNQKVREGARGGQGAQPVEGDVGGGGHEDDSVEGENHFLFPGDHVNVNHNQSTSTGTGSSLQYRFYDRSNDDHRRRQPRDLYEYQEKCKVLDKKTDFLAKYLGLALKENMELKKRLTGLMEKNKMDEVKCEDSEQRHSDNGRNPLLVFPEEVWQMIFGFVEDPGDLENCYKGCVTFRNMLKDKKAFFLFPKVFKLVNSKYPFTTSSILNLRLASKPFKKLADLTFESRPHLYNFHYLNEHEYNQSEEFRYTFNIDDPFILRPYKIGYPQMEQLIQKLNSSSSFFKNLNPDLKNYWSPIPSRHLIINDKDIPNSPSESDPSSSQNFPTGNYRHATFSILNKIGHHLKFLDTWIHLSFTPESWYNMLYNWLYYTPNVQVLQFRYPFPVPIQDEEDSKKFTECVNSHPFPNLPKLVMLTLENCPMVLINSVIKANPQIEQLQILRHNQEESQHKVWKWERLNFSDNLLSKLINLRKISVTIRDDLEFQQFEKVNWPKLEIIKTSITISTKGSWERIISWLNGFKESLETLIIKLPFEWNPFFVWRNAAGVEEEERKRILLECPKLKKLRISMRFLTSIDFILGLVSLEDLYVFVDHMDYEEALISDQLKVANGQIIQFNEFYECMELSNIWDVMSALKRVYVAVRDKNHGFLICRRYKYRKIGSGVVEKVNC